MKDTAYTDTRLDFAKHHEKQSDEYWEHILWPDETVIN